MKLKSILLEKLPGGVKAKMLSLEQSRKTQWKFTLRLIDPILKDVSMKWGYVTTALDSEDFDRKKINAGAYNNFKLEVLDKANEWVFVTKKAPKKRTYGVRQIIEAEVEAIPKNTEQLQKPIDPNNPTTEEVVLNTKKMKLMDKVRGIELYEKPYKYPYEPIKTAQAKTDAGGNGGIGGGGGGSAAAVKAAPPRRGGGDNNNAAETITYDPAKSNVVNNSVKAVQQKIIDTFDSRLQNIPTYQKFKSYGPDGKFVSSTRDVVKILQKAYGLPATGNITTDIMKKIGM